LRWRFVRRHEPDEEVALERSSNVYQGREAGRWRPEIDNQDRIGPHEAGLFHLGSPMMEFPRLALATRAAAPEPSLATVALLAGLTERRWRVQHFRTRACPTATEAVGQVTGLPGRHLDAWLMPPPLCRALFARAARSTELALVEGTLDEVGSNRPDTACDCPGELKPIAEILDLPVVAVVSCREIEAETSHLPRLPEHVDAVLLDGLTDPAALPRLKRLFHLTAKLPVIGAIENLPAARAALESLPRGGRLPDELISELACAFRKRQHSRPAVRVAYAHDDAFGGYFPDTLEALEALGADLVEFSPLRDERLPEGADLVMIGCGVPDQHAGLLASNVSMIAALREHVCRGRRIYSEGGGTAYLGRRMIVDERCVAGAGIYPFDAELLPDPGPPAPVTRRLLHDCWLGPAGTVVRGYKSLRWRLTPSVERFECPACFGSLSAEGDWFYHHHAVGSLLHLHLGALAEVVDAFVGPHSPSLRRPTPRPAANRNPGHTDEHDREPDSRERG
jgi:cobyrinic acid a,c-diamide synthase